MLSNRSLLIQGSIFRCQFCLSTSVQAAWNKRKSPMACNQRLQLLPSWKLKERQNVRHPMGIERISWKDIIRHTKKLHLCLEISLHQITWHEWVLDQDRQNQLLVTLSFAYDKSALRCIRSLAENSKKEAQQESPLNTWNAKIWGRQISPGSKVRES